MHVESASRARAPAHRPNSNCADASGRTSRRSTTVCRAARSRPRPSAPTAQPASSSSSRMSKKSEIAPPIGTSSGIGRCTSISGAAPISRPARRTSSTRSRPSWP